MKLTPKQRSKLPDTAFALPGRRYPIHNESHARNALARVAQFGTASEKVKVQSAVKRRFPSIDAGSTTTHPMDRIKMLMGLGK